MKHDLFFTKRYGRHLAILLIVLGGVTLGLVFFKAHTLTNALLKEAGTTQTASPLLSR